CATLCVFVHREEERPDIEPLRRVHLLLDEKREESVSTKASTEELLNCKEESQRLNEMSTTLNDITNVFDNADKTTNGLSKCESCPEKGKLEKSMNNVIHKENRDKKFEPLTTNLNGSFTFSNDNFFEDLKHNKHDNKRTIKPQNDEINHLRDKSNSTTESTERRFPDEITIWLEFEREVQTWQPGNKKYQKPTFRTHNVTCEKDI
ncbi:1875_t:CDS:2, partial [Gigaspora margarita]